MEVRKKYVFDKPDIQLEEALHGASPCIN